MTTEETIICGRIVTPFQVIEDGMLVVQGERIADVGQKDLKRISGSSHVMEFNNPGDYVIPGFVDIHCHGGGGVLSYDNPQAFAEFHLQHGTTSILPTFVYNHSHAEIMQGLQKVLAAMEQKNSSVFGIHMEGPYINPKYGAITAPIREVNPEEYREILALAGEQIRLWTLAPELEGQQQFMEEASAHGIVFSVGHSEASPEVIFDAVRLGLRVGCHLTNASGVTPNITRYGGTREVGVHEAVMVHDHMYAEVIPDQMGIHVRPLMLRLIVKTKGADKVIIITDGVNNAGISADGRDVNMKLSNEHSPSGPGKEILSGSLLTMDRAVHNMRLHTGIGMVDACKMSALNPAIALGAERDVGSLERGKKANLLVVSEEIRVKMVMLAGNVIHQIQ